MPSVYDLDNFQGRINLASQYILQGRNTIRSFDTCMQRCQYGIKQTVKRSVTRMSDNGPEERRKTNLTQTPN